MKTSHHIDELFARLNDTAQEEVLRIAELPVDQPPRVSRESEHYRAALSEWMAEYRHALLPVMLRVRDWPDNDIEKLVDVGDLRIGEPTRVKGITIRMSLGMEVSVEGAKSSQQGILLPDLAAASEALTDAFLALSAASRPLGQTLEVPEGIVSKGSVGFSLPGGFLGSGIGLLVIAGSGLIAPPSAAYIGGAVLASADAIQGVGGIIDKWLDWQGKRLDNEKKRLEIRRAEAELDKQKCEDSNAAEGQFAHSSLVPRHVVQTEAEHLGLTEECSNHLLNRCIPIVYTLVNRIPRMSVEKLAENPLISLPGHALKLKPLPGFTDSLKDGTDGPEMVKIPGGTFLMGSPESETGRSFNERQHEVTLNAFAIGKYAVTFDEFDQFAKAMGRDLPADYGWGRGRRPVVDVSWQDAVGYTEWLSRETGKRYRLPTEAEWEYAARAGTRTAYWWWDQADSGRANCGETPSDQTLPVDTFEPNPWGLYNMLGNTWEWTCSAYTEEYDGSETRCIGADEKGRRVVRGGAWLDVPGNLRSAYRSRNDSVYRGSFLGFRLAQDL